MEVESRAPSRKPLLLKDYLVDDYGSSCSSSGFRSYPRRRECCTTVRFLLETDLRARPRRKIAVQNGGAAAAKAPTVGVVSAALQRASRTVINAVKSLQFTSSATAKSANQRRSFSRKLARAVQNPRVDIFAMRRSLKKKSKSIDSDGIGRLKLTLSEFSPAIITVAGDSNGSSESKSNNSWSDSDFTVSGDSLQSSSCSSDANSTEQQNDVVVAKCSSAVTNKSVSIHSTAHSPNRKKQLWSNEEKEQFSPVSVLDYPFEDEDEVSSPLHNKLNLTQGTTKKLMKKMKRFECVTQLEPLNLVKRITFPEPQTGESPNTLVSGYEEKIPVESKAATLLRQLKARTPLSGRKLKAVDRLLLDFFRESIIGEDSPKLVQIAEDWINGKSQRFLYEWEVQANRQAYIKDMESREEWKKMDEEYSELGLQLETEVLTSLVDELLVDLI